MITQANLPTTIHLEPNVFYGTMEVQRHHGHARHVFTPSVVTPILPPVYHPVCSSHDSVRPIMVISSMALVLQIWSMDNTIPVRTALYVMAGNSN